MMKLLCKSYCLLLLFKTIDTETRRVKQITILCPTN